MRTRYYLILSKRRKLRYIIVETERTYYRVGFFTFRKVKKPELTKRYAVLDLPFSFDHIKKSFPEIGWGLKWKLLDIIETYTEIVQAIIGSKDKMESLIKEIIEE